MWCCLAVCLTPLLIPCCAFMFFPGFLYCIHATLQKVLPKPSKNRRGMISKKKNVEKSQGHREPHGSKSCFPSCLITLPALILRGFHVCFMLGLWLVLCTSFCTSFIWAARFWCMLLRVWHLMSSEKQQGPWWLKPIWLSWSAWIVETSMRLKRSSATMDVLRQNTSFEGEVLHNPPPKVLTVTKFHTGHYGTPWDTVGHHIPYICNGSCMLVT